MKIICHFIILLSFATITYGCKDSHNQWAQITIHKKNYRIEVASTTKERAKGLMFRKTLKPNEGMLFVYPYAQPLNFYMKNTIIPLDIAFIDANFIIIDIKSMEPLDETIVSSSSDACYALEMNQGFFAKKGINVGDTIEIITPLKRSLE